MRGNPTRRNRHLNKSCHTENTEPTVDGRRESQNHRYINYNFDRSALPLATEGTQEQRQLETVWWPLEIICEICEICVRMKIFYDFVQNNCQNIWWFQKFFVPLQSQSGKTQSGRRRPDVDRSKSLILRERKGNIMSQKFKKIQNTNDEPTAYGKWFATAVYDQHFIE